MKKINQNTTFKIGQKIRIERIKRQISQEKLAELANLNRNYIGMIERGETSLTVRSLESIANAFEVDIKELFVFTI